MSGNGPVDKGPDSESEGNAPDDLSNEISKITDYLGSSGEDYSSLPDESGEGNRAGDQYPKSPNNVEHDRFDHRLYGELHEACEEVRNLEKSEGAFDTFPELLSDFFYSFYKAAPRLADEGTVEDRSASTNRPFVERLLEDDETIRTRISTRLDDMSAALAALAAGEKVLEEIEDRPDLAEFIEQVAPPEHGFDEDDPGEDDPCEEDGDAGSTDEEDDEGGNAEQEASSGQGPGEGQAGSTASPPSASLRTAPPRDLRRAIRAAAQAGAKDAEKTQEALDGWGLSPADLSHVPLGERIELAKSLRNPRFKHLFDLVGRMRNLAHAKSSEKVKSRADEIHSVELSGDLERMLPSELAAGLASKSRARKLDFYRRFTEGQVLSYELTANEPQAKGPIVAAIDCSDSMGFGGGANMQWAIAVALALVDLACGGGARGADKRPAALVFFNEDVKKVVRFAPGERDPRKLLEVATVGASGGTRYEPAWKQLLALCDESTHQGADILFVTDGICSVSEEFAAWILEEKARMKTTSYSVLLGSDNCHELERYSDEVWTTKDLASASDQAAAEIFDRLG